MKKLLCVLLAVVLICSVLTPISVFAENGPYTDVLENFDPDNLENIMEMNFSAIMIMDMYSEDEELSMMFAYPEIEGMVTPSNLKGVSYDLETNTLTFKSVKAPGAMVMAVNMGDDFKINLIGYNEMSSIISSSTGRGASVTLTGSGELVVNKDLYADSGIAIDGGDSAAFFKAEKDVDLKIYADEEYEGVAVLVDGSTITDPAQLIQLEGTVKAGGSIDSLPYTVNLYETIEGYDLDFDVYDYCDAVFKKDGQLCVGFEEYDYETFEVAGYTIFPVTYDETLACYITDVIEDYDAYFYEDYASAGYELVPDNDVPLSFKDFLIAEEKTEYNLALSADSTVKYGFDEYPYYGENGETEYEYTVYKVIEHEKLGYVLKAISNENLDGLVPQKTGEKNYCVAAITETLVMNEGGSVAPATVKLLSAKNTSGGITVTWTPLKNAESYRIYRKAAGDKTWTVLDTIIGAQKSSYKDTTTQNGVKYTYTVKAFNKVGAGGYNKTGVSAVRLKAPSVKLSNGAKGIYISWNKVAGAKSYKVYRKVDGAKDWTAIKSGFTGTVFLDKTAKSGVTYHYTVRAINGTSASTFGDWKINFLATPVVTSLTNTLDGVLIKWNKVPGAKQYVIYSRNLKTGKWERAGVAAGTAFLDKIGSSNTDMTYTVRAQAGTTFSAYNKTGYKIHHIKAPAFTAKNVKNGIQLEWSNVADATGYRIFRRVKGTSAWTVVVSQGKADFKNIGKSSPVYAYVDTNVKTGVTYEYAMRSLSPKANSANNYQTIVCK